MSGKQLEIPPATPTPFDKSMLSVLLDDLPEGQKVKLAKQLGISRRTLARRIVHSEQMTYSQVKACHAFLEDYAGSQIDIEYLTSPVLDRVA